MILLEDVLLVLVKCLIAVKRNMEVKCFTLTKALENRFGQPNILEMKDYANIGMSFLLPIIKKAMAPYTAVILLKLTIIIRTNMPLKILSDGTIITEKDRELEKESVQ